jgi:hypothetical protein
MKPQSNISTPPTSPINDLNVDMESKNKIFLLEDEKNKLEEQLEAQRKFF